MNTVNSFLSEDSRSLGYYSKKLKTEVRKNFYEQVEAARQTPYGNLLVGITAPLIVMSDLVIQVAVGVTAVALIALKALAHTLLFPFVKEAKLLRGLAIVLMLPMVVVVEAVSIGVKAIRTPILGVFLMIYPKETLNGIITVEDKILEQIRIKG